MKAQLHGIPKVVLMPGLGCLKPVPGFWGLAFPAYSVAYELIIH